MKIIFKVILLTALIIHGSWAYANTDDESGEHITKAEQHGLWNMLDPHDQRLYRMKEIDRYELLPQEQKDALLKQRKKLLETLEAKQRNNRASGDEFLQIAK